MKRMLLGIARLHLSLQPRRGQCPISTCARQEEEGADGRDRTNSELEVLEVPNLFGPGGGGWNAL